MVPRKIKIEVAFATIDKQTILSVEVDEGITIQEAIITSCIRDQFPEIDLTTQAVGVFGQRKALTDKVLAGDRIEIYRPLQIDPKEARRKRHKK